MQQETERAGWYAQTFTALVAYAHRSMNPGDPGALPVNLASVWASTFWMALSMLIHRMLSEIGVNPLSANSMLLVALMTLPISVVTHLVVFGRHSRWKKLLEYYDSMRRFEKSKANIMAFSMVSLSLLMFLYIGLV